MCFVEIYHHRNLPSQSDLDNLFAQFRHKKSEINHCPKMKRSPCKAAPGGASAQPERQPHSPQDNKN